MDTYSQGHIQQARYHSSVPGNLHQHEGRVKPSK
jgi:hypothetical protein